MNNTSPATTMAGHDPGAFDSKSKIAFMIHAVAEVVAATITIAVMAMP
mgnify:CR=1 FL=1